MAKHNPKKRKGLSPQFIRRLSSWLILSTALTVAVRSASTLYWDSDGSAAGNDANAGTNLGGSGTWTNAGTTWWDGTSATDTSWNSLDVAAFVAPPASTATVNVGEPITVGGLSFNSAGFTLTGTGANILTITGVVGPATAPLPLGITASASATIGSGVALGSTQIWFVAPSQTLLVTGQVINGTGGPGGIIKAGGGTLTLQPSGVSNTYTGTTTITGGVLEDDVSGTFSGLPSTGSVIFGGGTLRIANLSSGDSSQTVGGFGFVTNSSSHVTFVPGTGTSLALNIASGSDAITRNPGANATLEFVLPASSFNVERQQFANSFLGGWATVLIPTTTLLRQ